MPSTLLYVILKVKRKGFKSNVPVNAKIAVGVITMALLIAVPMLFVNAEENKWEVKQPEKLTTSEGIIVDSEFDYDYDEWAYYYRVTFTIPEDYSEESFVISPEITKYIYENYNEYINKILGRPGDTFLVTITIVNNSKYQYNYEDSSFVIYPDSYEGAEYKKVEPKENETTFNGNDIKNSDNKNNVDTIYRNCNTAIQAIFPYCKASKNNDEFNSYLSDEVLDSALKEMNYKGIEDLDKYYLDFYNKKYNTDNSNLNQFSKGILREILGDRDPIMNAIYSLRNKTSELKNFQSMNNKKLNNLFVADTRKDIIDDNISIMSDVENYLKSLGYESIQDYLLKYFNETYNCNASNLNELNDEASSVFYSYNGSESSTGVLESNAELIKLSYDVFYNNLLSYGFDYKNENKNDETSDNYSIGEYMRDEDKGDDAIKEKVGTLLSGDSKSLNNTVLKINGRYTNNAYQNYNFNFHMHLKYNALKGNLIVRYIDQDGNELIKEITNTGMVGNSYITELKEFDGYVFDKVEGEVEGNYIDGTIVVTYIYMNAENAKGGDVIEELPPQTGIDSQNVINSFSFNILFMFIFSLLIKLTK